MSFMYLNICIIYIFLITLIINFFNCFKFNSQTRFVSFPINSYISYHEGEMDPYLLSHIDRKVYQYVHKEYVRLML